MLDPNNFDSVGLRKKRTIDELRAEKARKLDAKLARYGITGRIISQPDADSFNVELPDGSIQNIRASGIDAPDDYFTDTAESQAKKAQQIRAYSDLTGMPIDQVTDANLSEWKKDVAIQAAKAGFGVGDSVTYIPTGDASQAAGDSRIISDIYNRDRRTVSELFNTPGTNAAYFAPFNTNTRQRLEAAREAFRQSQNPQQQSGYDAAGNARAVLQPDGYYSYGDTHGLTRNQIDATRAVERTNEANWGKPGDLINSIAGTVANVFDAVKPLARQGKSRFTGPDRVTTELTYTEGFFEHNNIAKFTDPTMVITPDEARMYDQYIEKMRKVSTRDSVTEEELALVNSPKGQAIAAVREAVQLNQADQRAITRASDNIRNTIYASGLDAKIKEDFDANYKKNGIFSAFADMMTEHPLHAVDQLAQSLPVMITALNPAGLYMMYRNTLDDATLERQTRGEEITGDDLVIMKAASATATAFERLGAEVIFKKIPGLDKFAVALFKASPTASRILTPMMKILGASAGEGISEAGTSVSEQIAQGKKLDATEIAYAASIGAGGGGSIKGPGAAVDLARGQRRTLQREQASLKARLDTGDTIADTAEGIDIQATIDDIDFTLRESPSHSYRSAMEAEREILQARLAEANPEALPGREREKLQAQYDSITEALGTTAPVTPIPETPDTDTQSPVIEEEQDTSEIFDNELQASLDSISLEAEDFDASMETIIALNARKMTPERKALLDAKKAELREVRRNIDPEGAPTEEASPVIDTELDSDITSRIDEAMGINPVINNKVTELINTIRTNVGEEQANQAQAYAETKMELAIKQRQRRKTSKKKPFRNINLEEEVTAEDEARAADQVADSKYLKTIKRIQKLGSKIRGNRNADTMKGVGKDVRTGIDPRWTGFDTYLSAINKAAVKAASATTRVDINAANRATRSALGKVLVHSNNISAKSKALSSALAKAKSTGQAQYVRGNTAEGYDAENNRVMEYVDPIAEKEKELERKLTSAELKVEQENLQAAYDNRKESGEYIYRIDDTPQGQSIVSIVNDEAKYGEAVLEAAKVHQKTSFVRESSQEAKVATRRAQQDAALEEQEAPKVQEAATGEQLDVLDNLGEIDDTTDEVPTDTASSPVDSDVVTQEGDTPQERAPVETSPETTATEEQSEAVPEESIPEETEQADVDPDIEGQIPEANVIDRKRKRLISDERYQEAVDAFGSLANQLNSGIDPKLISALSVIVVRHLESGIYAFNDVAASTIVSIREKYPEHVATVRAGLVSAYNMARLDKRAKKFLSKMTPENEVLDKYEVVPGGLANKEQRKAIRDIGDWIGDTLTAATYFVLEGRGGTGKTAVVQKIIANAIEQGSITQAQVLYTATTHTAKTTLAEATQQETMTIWRALGIRPPDEMDVTSKAKSNEIVDVENADNDPLEGIKILIIDESSMLGEGMLSKIESKLEGRGIKVLFLGDGAQIVPVRPGKEPSDWEVNKYGRDYRPPTNSVDYESTREHEYGANATSRVFDEVIQDNDAFKQRIRLVTPQRQNAESPILKLTLKFTNVLDSAQRLKEAVFPKLGKKQLWGIVKNENTNDRVNDFDKDTNSGVLHVSKESFLESFIEDYKANPENTRIISGWNEEPKESNQGGIDDGRDSVYNLNRRIFNILHPNRTYGIYEAGDKLIAYTSVLITTKDDPQGETGIWNGSEYEVMEASTSKTTKFTLILNDVNDWRDKNNYTIDIPYQTVTLRNTLTNETIESTVPIIPDEGIRLINDGTTPRAIKEKRKGKDEGVVFPHELQRMAKETFRNARFAMRYDAAAYSKFKASSTIPQRLANTEFHPHYAMTSWKAQGSTYRNAYVLEDSIRAFAGYSPTGMKTAYHAMYVAISRPTDKLVIISEKNPTSNDAAMKSADNTVITKNVVTGTVNESKVTKVPADPPADTSKYATKPEGAVEKTHKGIKFWYVEGELKTKSGVNALAYTTEYLDSNGNVKPVVLVRGDLTAKEVLEHITGSKERILPNEDVTATQISKQKEIVSSFMLTFGINLPEIVSKLSDRQALSLVIRHELSHIDRNHRNGYLAYTKQILAGKDSNADNKYLNDRALIRESEANLDALVNAKLITHAQYKQSIAYLESLRNALGKPNRIIIANADKVNKKSQDEIRAKFAAYMDGKDVSNVVIITGIGTFSAQLAKEFGVSTHQIIEQDSMAAMSTDLIVDNNNTNTANILKLSDQYNLNLAKDTEQAPPAPPVTTEEDSGTTVVEVSEVTPKIPGGNFLNVELEEGYTRLTANDTSGKQFEGKGIEAFVKITESRKGIFNIPSEVFDDPNALAAALMSFDPAITEEIATAAVTRYVQLANVYSKLTKTPVQTQYGVDTLRIPLELLKVVNDTDGEAVLPPQVILAISMGLDHWINQNYTSRPFATSKDAANFMYGNMRAQLDQYDEAIVHKLGLSHIDTTREIGMYVQKLLGMSAVSTQTQPYMDALSAGMGTLALQLVNTENIENGTVSADIAVPELHVRRDRFEFAKRSSNGLIRSPRPKDPKKVKEGVEYLTNKEVKEINDAGRNFEHGAAWLSIEFTQDGPLSNRSIEDIRAAHTKSSILLDKLGSYTTDENNNGILNEQPKTVTRNIKNSLGRASDAMVAVMDKMQRVVWTPTDAMSLIATMYKANPELVKKQMGVVKYEADFEPKRRIDSINASNKDKIAALERTIESYEDGLLDRVFFKYRLMNQHRMMMQGAINPQNSHVDRYLLSPEGTTTYTKENIHLFKYAVMFSFGYSVDKKVDVSISQTFSDYLKDPNIRRAAELIGQENVDTAALSAEIEIITNRYSDTLGDTDLSLFNGLVALSKYLAVDTSQENFLFESDIGLEIDGVSNGFSINLMQFPMFEEGRDGENAREKALNHVAVYIGENQTHLKSGIHDPGSAVSLAHGGNPPVGAYEDLMAHISEGMSLEQAIDFYSERMDSEALKDFKGRYERQNAAMGQLMPLLGEVKRELVKYPFMIFMYGGGLNSITRGVASQGIDQLYEQIGVLRKQFVTRVPEFNANMEQFLEQLKALGVSNADRTNLKTVLEGTGIGAKERFQAFSFNDNNLSFIISEIIKPRFDYGLNAMLGDTSRVRKSVIQAGELMHAIFLQRFNIAKAKYLKDNNRKDSFLSDRELEEIATSNEVINWIPKFIGPLTNDNKNEFIDLTKRSSQGIDGRGLTVETVLRLRKSDQRNVTTETKQKNFTSPGVSALIRAIINIDAAMLATAMNEMPNLLPLYDAAMGRPEQLKDFAIAYNEAFEKFGFETNITDQFNKRVKYLQNLAKNYDDANGTTIVEDANTWVLENLHDNKFTDEKSDFEAVGRELNTSATDATKAKTTLENIKDADGMTFNQMFMRDLTDENPSSGTSVDERRAEIRASAEARRRTVLFSTLKLPYTAKNILTRLVRASGTITVGDKLREFDPLYITRYIDLMLANEEGKKSTPITDLVLELGKEFGTDPKNYMNEGKDAVKNLITGKNRTYAIEAGTKRTGEVNKLVRKQFSEQLKTDVSFVDINREEDQDIIDVMSEYLTPDDKTIKSLENQRKENPATVLETAIDSTNVRQLFDRFKTASKKYYDSDVSLEAHAASMEQVLEAITRGVDHVNNLNLEVETINGVTQGEYNAAQNLVRIAASRDIPGGRNAHSPQEVYLHEMVHALTVHAMAGNKGLTEQIYTVRKSVRKAIDAEGGYRIFLPDTEANSSPNEIQFAKDQYRYLFSADARNVPEEFLAYALTNPAMIKALQNHDRYRPDRGEGLIAMLQSVFDLVIDYFIRAINRRRINPNGHAEMIAIAQQLIDLNSKHADIATKGEMKATEFLDDSDKKVVDFVKDKSQKILQSTRGSSLGQISGAVIGGASLFLSENEAVQRAKLQIYSNLHGVASSLFNELGDGALTPPLIKMLLHANNKINKLYQQLEMDAVRRVEESWKSTTKEEVGMRTRQAMTRVLYRTDLSSLLSRNFTLKQIQQLLANSDNTDAYIKTMIEEMGLKRSSDAIRYAEELGYHMATKKSRLSNGHFNVHTIAAKFLSPEQNTPDNIKRLDAIATLAALKEQDSADLKLVGNLMAAEIEADPNDNAFSWILESHRAYVADSLSGLFDNNPAQMVKGYTQERIDNLTDVQTGLGDPKTKRRMKLAGYGEPYTLANIPGVPQAHTSLYVSRYMPEIRHVSGIISTTGLHHKGTLISEILSKDPQFQKANGTPDMRKIANKLNEIRKQEDKHARNKTKHTDHNLRPIYDENGNISDYRVIMDIENQEKLFQPDIEFQNVFAHMRSAYISKKNTITADLETIDLLVDEQVRMEPTGKYKFINILDPQSKYYDRYKKLPDEVRRYMSQYVIDGKFMVREDIINKVFGYPALDFSRLPGIQSEIMAPIRFLLRNLHYGLRKFMTFGMERIVMANLNVILRNIRSNAFQLSIFEKIPPSYTAAKIKEGTAAFARYDADNRDLRDTIQDQKIAEVAGNVTEVARLQKVIDAINEQIEENPIHRIAALGIDTLILEGVNTASKEGFFQRAHKMLQADRVTKYSKNMPTTVGTVAKNMVLTRDSEIYKMHKKTVQLTDFLSRYALISYRTEVKGEDFDSVFHDAVDAFVLFDENMHPVFELINSMGFTAFLSYWLRVTRPVRRYIQRSPFSVATAVGTESITGIDTTAMWGGSIPGGKLLPNNFYMDDLADAATTIYGPVNLATAATDLPGLILGD